MTNRESKSGREFLQPRTDEKLGREYQRVSMDKSGIERSQDEQHEDSERVCVDFGIVLGEPYREVGSASRYARKERDDFKRLLTDLEEGTFGADYLVLWEGSRGSRKVSEWVTLIELCEAAGVRIFITTHERVYNPGNARDRKNLLSDAIDSEYEASQTSRRGTRDAAYKAAEGRPSGRPPFGYKRRYDSESGKLIDQVENPDESPVIRELFDYISEGKSLRWIVRKFDAEGYRNRSGKSFTPQQLRDMALNPAYGGYRMHLGGTGGSTRHRGFTPGAQRYAAKWEPLVKQSTFLDVQRILLDPSRKTRRPGRVKHEFSVIARCDVCRGLLRVRHKPAHPDGMYTCESGHVNVSVPELDKYLMANVLRYLARPDVRKMMETDSVVQNAELAAVQSELVEARAELEGLRRDAESGELTRAMAKRMEPPRLKRVEELEAREGVLVTPSALRGLIKPGAGVENRWEETQLSTRREVYRLVLVPERLGMPYVQQIPKADRKKGIPARDRVRWETSDQPDSEQADS